jgi:hypothetical protein
MSGQGSARLFRRCETIAAARRHVTTIVAYGVTDQLVAAARASTIV